MTSEPPVGENLTPSESVRSHTVVAGSSDVVRRKDPVALRKRDLADVLAGELPDLLHGREGGELLAAIDLAGRGDRLDARGATDVRPDEIEVTGHRVDASVDRAGMQRDPHVQPVR